MTKLSDLALLAARKYTEMEGTRGDLSDIPLIGFMLPKMLGHKASILKFTDEYGTPKSDTEIATLIDQLRTTPEVVNSKTDLKTIVGILDICKKSITDHNPEQITEAVYAIKQFATNFPKHREAHYAELVSQAIQFVLPDGLEFKEMPPARELTLEIRLHHKEKELKDQIATSARLFIDEGIRHDRVYAEVKEAASAEAKKHADELKEANIAKEAAEASVRAIQEKLTQVVNTLEKSQTEIEEKTSVLIAAKSKVEEQLAEEKAARAREQVVSKALELSLTSTIEEHATTISTLQQDKDRLERQEKDRTTEINRIRELQRTERVAADTKIVELDKARLAMEDKFRQLEDAKRTVDARLLATLAEKDEQFVTFSKQFSALEDRARLEAERAAHFSRTQQDKFEELQNRLELQLRDTRSKEEKAMQRVTQLQAELVAAKRMYHSNFPSLSSLAARTSLPPYTPLHPRVETPGSHVVNISAATASHDTDDRASPPSSPPVAKFSVLTDHTTGKPVLTRLVQKKRQ